MVPFILTDTITEHHDHDRFFSPLTIQQKVRQDDISSCVSKINMSMDGWTEDRLTDFTGIFVEDLQYLKNLDI